MIPLILPRAKIIHVMRDPVDTCLSCFMHLFTPGQTFTYDMAELGRHYRQYSELMEHWRRVLPAGTCSRCVTRTLSTIWNGKPGGCSILRLAWDPACLNFHKNDRPIRTASNVQVRRPLYRSALGRWRRYEAHLGPLLADWAIWPGRGKPRTAGMRPSPATIGARRLLPPMSHHRRRPHDRGRSALRRHHPRPGAGL